MRNRSVIEIIVLTFTFVVALSLLGVGATIAIIEIKDPTVDTSAAVDILFTVISILIGALLGMLSAKGLANIELSKRPNNSKSESEE